jgi:hypothetical protein
MCSRGRFALTCLVVLASVTSSSARDTASITDAVRVPPTAETAFTIQLQKRDLPWPTQADVRERQMLAWLILLMKDRRGAR